METYLVAKAGSTSGLGIRSIRVCTTPEELKAALEPHDFPGRMGARAEFPYRLRVYKCTPNAQPKKLDEYTVLRILGYQGRTKFPDSPGNMRKGQALTFGDMSQMRDKSTVWVEYRNPETGELLINEAMSARRSYKESTKALPIWKLFSLTDKSQWEWFIQAENCRTNNSYAFDEDGMRLFKAVP